MNIFLILTWILINQKDLISKQKYDIFRLSYQDTFHISINPNSIYEAKRIAMV